MVKLATILVLAIISYSSALWAEEEEIINKTYLICKNKKEVRTMRVQIGKDNLCRAYYSKNGSEKNVGSGRNHESCMNFVISIKTNLEKSNWSCRDISDTKITATTPSAS